MSSNLVVLPSNGLAPSNAAIAARMREMADAIEHDPDSAELRRVVVVFESVEGVVLRRVFGEPTDLARTVGLLQIAAARAAVE